jgi:hypothetical protein
MDETLLSFFLYITYSKGRQDEMKLFIHPSRWCWEDEEWVFFFFLQKKKEKNKQSPPPPFELND